MVLHHHTNIRRPIEPSAGRTMGVKVQQGHGLTLATQVSGQVGRDGAFTHAPFLTGDQNLESRHTKLLTPKTGGRLTRTQFFQRGIEFTRPTYLRQAFVDAGFKGIEFLKYEIEYLKINQRSKKKQYEENYLCP
jgi:hypothetical protein